MNYQTSNVILYGLTGSRTFGMHHDKSDYDYFGVFVNKTRKYWCINEKPPETVEDDAPKGHIVFHEIEKWLRLCAKGNPTCLEVLWFPEYIRQEFLGKYLVEHRDIFLSKLIKKTYLGYATGQFNRWVKGNTFAKGRQNKDGGIKHIRHLFRLYEQFEQLWKTGTLDLKVKDRDFYMKYLPTLSKDEIVKLAAKREYEILHNPDHATNKDALWDTKLPDEPNWKQINNILGMARRIYY